jgi:hypothetical protein
MAIVKLAVWDIYILQVKTGFVVQSAPTFKLQKMVVLLPVVIMIMVVASGISMFLILFS